MENLILFRGIERLLIVLGGIFALASAAYMLRLRSTGKTSLIFEQKEGASLSIQLLNASPAIFLALFGAAILAHAHLTTLKLTTDIGTLKQVAQLDKQLGQTNGKHSISLEYGETVNALRNFLEITSQYSKQNGPKDFDKLGTSAQGALSQLENLESQLDDLKQKLSRLEQE
ncbi:MAG: hypothetical protein FLDDKLPJ_03301 [Phycisphaerae bacterium]|nr:hypothetical protein [Phycisphaerae bacterium]